MLGGKLRTHGLPDADVAKGTHKMKTLTLLLCAFALSAHATLIDQTPGGFSENSPPPAFYQFLNHQYSTGTGGWMLFFDSTSGIPYTLPDGTHPPGWVSQFGVLNGGTYFFSNLGQSGPVANSTLSWNFTGTDVWLEEIYVWGRVDAHSSLTNLYTVPWNDRFISDGSVSLNGITKIDQIAFYGTDPLHVPDTGKTLWLLAFAFVALFALNFYNQSTNKKRAS